MLYGKSVLAAVLSIGLIAGCEQSAPPTSNDSEWSNGFNWAVIGWSMIGGVLGWNADVSIIAQNRVQKNCANDKQDTNACRVSQNDLRLIEQRAKEQDAIAIAQWNATTERFRQVSAALQDNQVRQSNEQGPDTSDKNNNHGEDSPHADR